MVISFRWSFHNHLRLGMDIHLDWRCRYTCPWPLCLVKYLQCYCDRDNEYVDLSFLGSVYYCSHCHLLVNEWKANFLLKIHSFYCSTIECGCLFSYQFQFCNVFVDNLMLTHSSFCHVTIPLLLIFSFIRISHFHIWYM